MHGSNVVNWTHGIPCHSFSGNTVFGHAWWPARSKEKKNQWHESCFAFLFPKCFGSYLQRYCQAWAPWQDFQACHLERGHRFSGRHKYVNVWPYFSISRGNSCGQYKEAGHLCQLHVIVGWRFWQRWCIHWLLVASPPEGLHLPQGLGGVWPTQMKCVLVTCSILPPGSLGAFTCPFWKWADFWANVMLGSAWLSPGLLKWPALLQACHRWFVLS